MRACVHVHLWVRARVRVCATYCSSAQKADINQLRVGACVHVCTCVRVCACAPTTYCSSAQKADIYRFRKACGIGLLQYGYDRWVVTRVDIANPVQLFYLNKTAVRKK